MRWLILILALLAAGWHLQSLRQHNIDCAVIDRLQATVDQQAELLAQSNAGLRYLGRLAVLMEAKR